MAEIKLNVPVGLTVGITPINSIDASNNATFNTLSVSGATTLGALSSSTLAVSGAATFSTIPTSPTPSLNDNTTKLATTAWFFTQKSNVAPLMDGVAAIGASTRWSPENHIHPSDTSRLTVINPSATGSLSVTGDILTGASTPIALFSQTWNNPATSFSGIKLTVTNTASSITSRILDLKVGSNEFGVDVNGSIVQKLSIPNNARDIVGVTGARHIREYQDLVDDGVQGLPGVAGVSTDSIEWGYTFNSKWDTGTSTYIKDRSNAGDHALMMRTTKKYTQDWWFSDGTTGGSAIAWTNKVKFDLPNSAYTFAGTINTTALNVSGNIQTGTWNATTISTTKGGTGRTTIGTANQFLGVNAAANGLEYKTFTSTDSSLSIMYPSAGVIDIKLVGTLPGNINFSGDLSVGGSAPNHKFLVLAASGNTDIKGTLAVTGATTLSSTLGVTGDFNVNTNKFNVTAVSGNTTIAGTLVVASATTLSSTLGVTGATTLSSTLGVTGDFNVNTNKFNVTAVSGNTAIAGTLGVTGATTLSSTLNVVGALSVNTNKFNVTAATGNTTIAGTLGVASATTLSSTLNVVDSLSVNTNKFNVTAATGNTTIAGTLGVIGKTTITDVSLNTLSLNDGAGDATLIAATTTTLVSAGTSTIATVPGTYKAVEFLVKCSVASAGAYQLIKLLAVNDGASTTAVTEFGNIEINDTGVSYDVTSAVGAMSLRATTTIANSVFTVIATSIK